MNERGVLVREGQGVQEVRRGELLLSSGSKIAFDECLWCTGVRVASRPVPLPRALSTALEPPCPSSPAAGKRGTLAQVHGPGAGQGRVHRYQGYASECLTPPRLCSG